MNQRVTLFHASKISWHKMTPVYMREQRPPAVNRSEITSLIPEKFCKQGIRQENFSLTDEKKNAIE